MAVADGAGPFVNTTMQLHAVNIKGALEFSKVTLS